MRQWGSKKWQTVEKELFSKLKSEHCPITDNSLLSVDLLHISLT